MAIESGIVRANFASRSVTFNWQARVAAGRVSTSAMPSSVGHSRLPDNALTIIGVKGDVCYRVADQLGRATGDGVPGRSGAHDGFRATSTGATFVGAGSVGFGRSLRIVPGGLVFSTTVGTGPLVAFHPPVVSSDSGGKIAGLPGLAVDHALSFIVVAVSAGSVDVST
jgi:hypothetical protein